MAKTRNVLGVLVLAAVAAAAPPTAQALELLAPDAECSLATGHLVVIGKDAKPPAGQGSLEWSGGTATLSAWLGRFSGVADLSAGPQEAKILFGGETLSLRLVVAPEVPGNLYTYHPKVLTEECAACHDPNDPPGPGSNVAKACYGCHTPYTARSSVHTPVAQGLCSACHDPHGSRNAAFLRWKPEVVCTACHNRPITKDHEKVKDDALCSECHDPHGSNRRSHLKRR
ncbi:MAG: hypothetical protein HZB55_22300 [Deltaproteobacteria bacterium]|nr:hypothetical protein [Deltaproteobacteria bacterium]